jgi:hypothetical protein
MRKINSRDISFFIIGGIVFSCISVLAGTILLSKNISYSNSNSSVTNVEDALNELYEKKMTPFIDRNFAYIGSEESFSILASGYYNLEVWGAQGGTYNSTYYGGYGAYSSGIVYLEKGSTIYVNVGGVGTCTGSGLINGGYNGGGNAYTSRGNGFYSCAGGGATTISVSSGLLSSLSTSLNNILIVGAGGGGSTYRVTDGYSYFYGGAGGGILGNSSQGTSGWSIRLSTGGSQSSGGYGGCLNGDAGATYGSFGLGGKYSSGTQLSGGGGGLYGGGSGNDTGGGGGSSYIGNSLLVSSSTITKHMTCYNCQTSTDASTMTNTTTNVGSTATTDYAKSGNGYARITYLGTSLN